MKKVLSLTSKGFLSMMDQAFGLLSFLRAARCTVSGAIILKEGTGALKSSFFQNGALPVETVF